MFLSILTIVAGLITVTALGAVSYELHLKRIENKKLHEELVQSKHNVELLSEAILKEDDKV